MQINQDHDKRGQNNKNSISIFIQEYFKGSEVSIAETISQFKSLDFHFNKFFSIKNCVARIREAKSLFFLNIEILNKYKGFYEEKSVTLMFGVECKSLAISVKNCIFIQNLIDHTNLTMIDYTTPKFLQFQYSPL
ncbi:unnamed protein product [Paramecium primaurelia]|uniref:Uncharacterized protein n=1 Tax=Paramecium primaurelia TaxID=5886 RepID=A0A8S1N5W7_PARPR|nr:unnamed protein product [Paramecium primaurelia]